MKSSWIRRFWIVPPVLVGLAVLFIAPMVKKPPQKAAPAERAVKVRIIEAANYPVTAKALGFGTTEPGRTWDAVAEVAGQVVWLSDDLKSGKLVAQGTFLLQIDDSAYKLALRQIEAQLSALEVRERATRATLELETRSQTSLEEELARKRHLHQQGTLSASELETFERSLLKGEATVLNLKNEVALIAAEREVLEVQRDSAELDLQRTRLNAPFDARITELQVSPNQYANRGQLLFSADGIDSVEIEARFPIGKLRPLIAGGIPNHDTEVPAVERIPGAMNLDALVRLKTATHTIEWPARVDRVAGLVDAQTQTLGVVITVDAPYEKAQPGQRPPLVRNTFVEVELNRRLEGERVVVPAAAVRGGTLNLVDAENRLEIRHVTTGFRQNGSAIIARGVEPGERVVISELPSAVEGMLLDPVIDESIMKRLASEATGRKASHP